MVIIENVRKFLWAFIELGFLTVLATILAFLILGDNAGVFVKSVTDNVMKFAAGVPTPSLIGLAVLVAIIYMVMHRLNLKA
jgi:hypothetical protein